MSETKTMTGWRRHWRWAVPGAVAAITVGGVGVAGLAADAQAPLPERSAEQLLNDLQTAKVDGLSGTVVQTSNLGVPDLGMGSDESAELSGTMTGTHTWRVWYGGQDKARLALLGRGGETNIIRNGDQVWTWNSSTKAATTYTLPEPSQTPELTQPTVTASPQEAASELLKALDPTTQVTTDGTGEVAGRQVYELVLTPRDSGTLVRSVKIAVDAQEKVPLRVQVNSKKIDEPAFEVGFSSVDFSVPEARQFEFTPPQGTTVTESTGKDQAARESAAEQKAAATQDGKKPEGAPTVVGEGWAAVAVGELPDEELLADAEQAATQAPEETGHGHPGAQQAPQDLSGMLGQLPERSGAWGNGRVLEGTLFSAIITDDGRYAVGAVPVSTLETALAEK